jgi:hypothetical protein
MFQSMLTTMRAAFWQGVRQVLVLGGAVLGTLTLAAILLPFLLGLALLATAQWAAWRTVDEHGLVVAPIAVG